MLVNLKWLVINKHSNVLLRRGAGHSKLEAYARAKYKKHMLGQMQETHARPNADNTYIYIYIHMNSLV